MATFRSLKMEAWRCNSSLFEKGVVFGTFGNASAFDPDRGVFSIKPSGIPYSKLKPADMVVVDLDGKVAEGSLNPSSDTPTHAVLYRNFSGIRGVCHTHSMYATAWAQAGRSVPILGTTHADHLAESVPCTPFMPDRMIQKNYEEETGLWIVRTFGKRSWLEVPMVLVAGHGPFTWGKTGEEAVENTVMLEQICRLAALTIRINPRTAPLKKALVERHYNRKHGKNATYGQKKG